MAGRTLIFGGRVCDGAGGDPREQDVLVENGRIADVGAPGAFDAADAERVDATGLLTAPGFIDAHSHGDLAKLNHPENRSKLLQGVTTEVDGNCGSSPSCVPGAVRDGCWEDLAGYARSVDACGCSTNTVALCGHNAVRQLAMGSRGVPAGADEIAAMRRVIERAFEAGAAGWSTGLTYFPGKFSDTAELKALSEATRESRRVYATHMRSEGDDLIAAVREAADVARAGSGILQISHLKTIFPRNFHKIDELLETIEEARASGLTIHADRYPYLHSSTDIVQTLPEPYFRDPEVPAKLRASEAFQDEVTEALRRSPRDLPSTIILSKRRTLSEIAEEEGVSVERACMREIMAPGKVTAAYLCMSGENLKRILSLPWVCCGSDAISMQLDDPASGGHPRSVGTFPRFFRMVSELCGVGEAVRRMTSLPAEIFGIPGRGLVRRGYVADLGVFDAAKFDSHAGFRGEDPAPSGVRRVIVGGRTAWDAARPETVGRFGRFLAIGR